MTMKTNTRTHYTDLSDLLIDSISNFITYYNIPIEHFSFTADSLYKLIEWTAYSDTGELYTDYKLTATDITYDNVLSTNNSMTFNMKLNNLLETYSE